MARTFDVVLPKRRVEKDTEVNAAQRASGDFARHLLANFPSEPVSYLPARICRAIFVWYCLRETLDLTGNFLVRSFLITYHEITTFVMKNSIILVKDVIY